MKEVVEGIDLVTGEIIKDGGKIVINWIFKLSDNAFVEGVD